MSLLDALHELSKEQELEGRPLIYSNERSQFEDDRDVPTVDEHLQQVGADAFNKFQRRMTNLDQELRNFANAARQLGSSVGILCSSVQLRERLAQLLWLFRENAADLFPRKVQRQPREMFTETRIHPTPKRKRQRAPSHVANPTVVESLDPEDFPEQLESLAHDVITFLDCLNEFPEFNDEAVNASILSFEGDLKYWASCLKAYDGQFRYPAVQRYLHDLTTEMGGHLDSITAALSVFIEIGVPTIRFAQKHASQNLLNLSTVATFFSAVTATTMQFSYQMTETPLEKAVNAFWFISLVFSIQAAVNSLLGLTWKQAMYRSPGHRVPWWVLIWIKRSPLVFLVASVACFSMGLVLFAYSSKQDPVTRTLTSVFSAFSCFGLAAVSTWFISERWIFLRHSGQKWLADVLSETKIQVCSAPGIKWIIYEPRALVWRVRQWCQRRSRIVREKLSRLTSRTARRLKRFSTIASSATEKVDGSDLEDQTLPSCNSPDPVSPSRPRMSEAGTGPLLPVASVRSPTIATSTVTFDSRTTLGEPAAGTDSGPSGSAKARFKNAVHSVIMLRQGTSSTSRGLGLPPRVPRRQRTNSTEGNGSKGGTSSEGPVHLLKASRVAALVPRLRALETTQDLAAHQALVRHLQFSPNGKFLATSSWDRTSVIFRVGESFSSHRVLAQPSGFVGQVAWSPNGSTLLTKLNRGVKVWTEDGVCKKTIDRRRTVQSVAWLPAGEAFLSVESSEVVKMDLNGQIIDKYHFDRMMLHDVAVTQDCQWLLCVGTLMASSDGLHPSKSRAEKQIIVYNLRKKDIENRVPVLHDVRDITLARDDLVALVSYENKAPPQLWKIDIFKDSARLSLRHTYMPKVPVDFAGPSYFGGKKDQLVLCAGKAGDIHIWDRESAALLHHVRAQALGGDLTCIAWNRAMEQPFMFATGSHDGGVRIWTTPKDSLAPAMMDLNIPPSRTTTNPVNTPENTPRSRPLSLYGIQQQTESPEEETTFELQGPMDDSAGAESGNI
ncbi:WD40 repeat-like protein [Laetiporus sulphureus 93-53]|uniref:WD40 repeat-like protein n=1 Tax=Laetiporus sulphureus 93-53 TaxID=1314785 RepID=A0A165B8R8_9APHY|nr:WD40 repeat-like protein [Laetiporus sulphureus 93-53]KZT00504.1 WD40 repeat-like protein [Laetiporus sulphureus 93-53]